MNDYHRYVCPKCGQILYSPIGKYTCPLCHHLMKRKDRKKHQNRPVVLFAILVIVFLSALLWQQNNKSTRIFNFTIPGITTKTERIENDSSSQQPKALDPFSLSSATADLHETLLNGMRERKSVITVLGYGIEEVKKESHAIIRDHPELFWLNSCSYRIQMSDFGTKIEILPQIYDFAHVEEKEQQLNIVVSDISSLIPATASDYDKALFIHDFIVNTTEYDFDAAGKEEFSDASTAYGCLVKHKAVCGGYAKAYKLLLDYVGVPCGYVTGDIIGRGLHAWNYITISGASAFVDVTWDDAVFSDPEETKGICSHEYFCITKQELSRTHALDTNQEIPACNSNSLDYFRLQGAYFEESNMDEVVQFILSSPKDTWVELKFSTPEMQTAVSQELFLDGWKTNYGYMFLQAGVHVTYSSKQTSQVLKVLMY